MPQEPSPAPAATPSSHQTPANPGSNHLDGPEVLGSTGDDAVLAAVEAALGDPDDPVLPIQPPSAAIRQACARLSTAALYGRVRAIRALVADRPADPTAALARTYLLQAQLLTARALLVGILAQPRLPRATATPAAEALLSHVRASLAWLTQQLPDLEAQLRALTDQQTARALWQATGDDVLSHAVAVIDELRTRHATALRTLTANPPAYLAAAIGPAPVDPAARDRWIALMQQVERYRLDHRVTDTTRPLGDRPTDPVVRLRFDRLSGALLEQQTRSPA